MCELVLKQPVRIHVTLEEQEGQPTTTRLSAKERAGRDATVEAFRKRFDCTLVDVKDLSQE